MRAIPHQPVSGYTRTYGLIGGQITHSKSFDLHNNAFKALSIDGIYIPIETTPKNLRAVVIGLKGIETAAGFNVTAPFKESIVPLMDEMSFEAEQIGAVNTVIKTQEGHFRGENTDIDGFIESLKTFQIEPKGKKILLLGAGGAARSTIWALTKMGCAQIHVWNRHAMRLSALKTDFKKINPLLELRPTDSLGHWHHSEGLIVNCTSVGGKSTDSPWPKDLPFPKGSIVLDLIYRETELLRKAKREGCLAFDGMEMLIQQAALSFSKWTGLNPPIDEMKNDSN